MNSSPERSKKLRMIDSEGRVEEPDAEEDPAPARGTQAAMASFARATGSGWPARSPRPPPGPPQLARPASPFGLVPKASAGRILHLLHDAVDVVRVRDEVLKQLERDPRPTVAPKADGCRSERSKRYASASAIAPWQWSAEERIRVRARVEILVRDAKPPRSAQICAASDISEVTRRAPAPPGCP